MKNLFKMLGIAAIVAVIGFAMACVTKPVNPEAPPEITVAMIGEAFSLNPDNLDAPMPVANITVKHPVAIKDWTIQVQPIRRQAAEGQAGQQRERPAAQAGDTPAGTEGERPAGQQRQSRGPFYQEEGKGTPPAEWKWNGKSTRAPRQEGGEVARIQSATDYQLTLTVNDIFDNTATYEGTISTDVLVRKDGEHYRIIVPSIVFPGGGSDLTKVTSEADQRSNARILRLIGRALNRYADYKVIIEGHSNPDYAPGTPQRDSEETKELIPLSQARAQSVLEYLVANDNVDRARLTAVGRGGTQVLVPFEADPEDKADNRRVEFILEK